MPVYCIGLSHRTASVDVRERFALTADAIPAALARLRAQPGVTEGVWLSTCNRVELYAVGSADAAEAVRRVFLEHARPGPEPDGEVMYVHAEPRSMEHLFKVACGLDSMVLGETEILGQLKKAYDLALQHGHTGARLNKAFQRAFNVAKQIRTQTQIQRGATSVAAVSVELAERIFESFEGRKAMLIGAGDTGEKVARAFLSRGVAEVRIHNRSPERAEALAAALGPAAKPWPDWTNGCSEIDIIVSSTSTPGYVLDVPRLEPLLKARRFRPLLLVDLAVPRDIDPAVINLSGVYLYNVDDLQMIADHHVRQREAEIAQCLAIIRDKIAPLLEGHSGPGPGRDFSRTAPA